MKQINNDTKEMIELYLDAAKNLYGVIKLSKLLSIYNSQNEPISEEQFLDIIETIDCSRKHYDFVGEDEFYENVDKVAPIERDLVAEYILFDIEDDPSYYYETKEEQIGKPYYIPEKAKLLKYADEFYYEKTLSFISLRAFFRNQPCLTKKQADELAEDIYSSANVYKTDLEAVINLTTYVFNFDDRTLDEFVPLYMDMFHDTRLHIHCGHTFNEIVKLI